MFRDEPLFLIIFKIILSLLILLLITINKSYWFTRVRVNVQD